MKKNLIATVIFSFLTVIFFDCNSSEQKKERKTSAINEVVDSAILTDPSAEMIATEVKRQRDSLQPSKLNMVRQTETVCAGQLPNGWIKINDEWNPTTCGNPTSISYNVWTIERYDDKPVGAIMTVCNQNIPQGWVKVSSSWNPSSCGHPRSISNNVIQIKRLN